MSQVRPIEDLFAELVALQTPAERDAYLEKVCGDDQALRGQLEKLLAAYDQAGSFFDPSDDIDPTIDAGEEALRGRQIGPYTLRERLGFGGMGVVWAAEQRQPLRRKVALKLIKPGMDTEQVIARFDAERTALALMDHPNIARVLDAGTTEQGRPYFVMELIRGIPITEYCDARCLTIQQRLSLFIQVCKAVQHAHQKGIIHRDIKPSNVLVTEQDGEPIPKVIDFGVAKALHQPLTERSMYSGVFQAIGTLAYMSPEQAGLSASDVDTRADIYGLGVLLYELLTGSTPFGKEELASAAFDEACRIIREKEPPKPSTRISTLGERAVDTGRNRGVDPQGLGRIVRGDLDWIVSKSLEKDRRRRYETASLFADDINRYLRNDAVVARPPSTWYTLRKTVVKHRGLALSASTVLAALLVGVLSSTYFALQLRAVLNELGDELTSVALNAVFSGNYEEAEAAISRAETARAPADRIRVLRGTALAMDGQSEQAIGELNKADDESIKAKAALYWAHWQNGGFGEMDKLRSSIGKKEWPEDDFDQLFLGIVRMAAGDRLDLSKLDDRLSGLIDRHPQWGIAYSLRSSQRTELAMESKQLDHFKQAINDHLRARTLIPDSPFVESSALYTLTYAIELAQQDGIDYQGWLDLAWSIVSNLKSREDNTGGLAHVAHFLYLFGDQAVAQELESEIVAAGICESSPKWAEMFRRRAPQLESELRKRCHSNPDDHDAAICLGLLLVEKSAAARAEALEIFDELMRRNIPWTYYAIAVDIPLLLGEQEKVTRALSNLPKDGRGMQWRWWNYIIDYYAGRIDDEQLLDLAGPFSSTGCLTKYAIAMKAMSEGDNPKAKAYFAEVRKTRRVGWSPYHWGMAFESRLDEDDHWCNWKKLETSDSPRN